MTKRYSIADARNQLARLVHAAEDGSVIELTRRGRPVAVVLSLEAYTRLTTKRPSLWATIETFRSESELLDDVDELFERPDDEGRDFSW